VKATVANAVIRVLLASPRFQEHRAF